MRVEVSPLILSPGHRVSSASLCFLLEQAPAEIPALDGALKLQLEMLLAGLERDGLSLPNKLSRNVPGQCHVGL